MFNILKSQAGITFPLLSHGFHIQAYHQLANLSQYI
jgi:hypothetical protein